jgi:hypothetical protein
MKYKYTKKKQVRREPTMKRSQKKEMDGRVAEN